MGQGLLNKLSHGRVLQTLILIEKIGCFLEQRKLLFVFFLKEFLSRLSFVKIEVLLHMLYNNLLES